MSLLCIRTTTHSRHLHLPLIHGRLDRLLERIVKRDGIRQGPARVIRRHDIPHVAQIMHRHARADNHHALIAQAGDGLAEAVVLVWVLRVEEGDLNEGHVQGVFVWVEGDVEACPDAVVETALDALGVNACCAEEVDDVCGKLGVALIRVGGFVHVVWEAVEAIAYLD